MQKVPIASAISCRVSLTMPVALLLFPVTFVTDFNLRTLPKGGFNELLVAVAFHVLHTHAEYVRSGVGPLESDGVEAGTFAELFFRQVSVACDPFALCQANCSLFSILGENFTICPRF